MNVWVVAACLGVGVLIGTVWAIRDLRRIVAASPAADRPEGPTP